MDLNGDRLLGHDLSNSGLHEKVFGLIEPVVDSVVVHLKKSCFDLHLLLAVFDHRLDQVIDNLLAWLFQEIDFLELVGLSLQSLSRLSVDLIMFVVDVVQLDEPDSSHLDWVLELAEVISEFITQLN